MSKTCGNCAEFTPSGKVIATLPPVRCGACGATGEQVEETTDADICDYWELRPPLTEATSQSWPDDRHLVDTAMRIIEAAAGQTSSDSIRAAEWVLDNYMHGKPLRRGLSDE